MDSMDYWPKSQLFCHLLGSRDALNLTPNSFLPIVKLTKDLSDQSTDPMKYLTKTLANQISQLKDKFDYIVIDGPPLFFNDALLLVEISDAIIACVPEKFTTLRQWKHELQLIESNRKLNSQIMVMMTKSRFAMSNSNELQQKYQKYK